MPGLFARKATAFALGGFIVGCSQPESDGLGGAVTERGAPHDPGMLEEHETAMGLLDPDDATHTAVQSGSWSDPTTWSAGTVPGDGADVYIPVEVVVTYALTSESRLHYVFVQGELEVATDVSTSMWLDTLIAGPTSTFSVGTLDNPVEEGVSAEFVVVDGAPIDLENDPIQISRGFLLHGTSTIHGHEKTPFVSTSTEASTQGVKTIAAGSSTIPISTEGTGWAVGDEVLVMGTRRGGYEDERRRITGLSAGEITLDRPLDFTHQTPSFNVDNVTGIAELQLYVANLSRNVRFRSESETQSVRGHLMFMHADAVDARYAAFTDLGRTRKDEPVNSMFNPGTQNPEGRYPLHLHRGGASITSRPSFLIGNVVVGSPGWGIVQHGAFAAVNDNVVHDVLGSGIVAEDGNEIGEWIGNFVSGIPGDGDVLTVARDEQGGDFGHQGEAYNVQARHLLFQGNVAANSNVGWVFRTANAWGDDDPMLHRVSTFPPDPRMLQYNVDPLGTQDPEEANFVAFDDNEVIASGTSFDSGHRQQVLHGADLKNQIRRLVQWNTGRFDMFNYTGVYIFLDCLFLGSGDSRAIVIPELSANNSFIRSHFEHWREGIYLGDRSANADGFLLDVTWANINQEFMPSVWKIPEATVNPVVAPVLELAADADLELSPNDLQFRVAGTVTDSFGERALYASYWMDFGPNELYESGNSPQTLVGDDGYHPRTTHQYEHTRLCSVVEAFPAKQYSATTKCFFEGLLPEEAGFQDPGLFELYGIWRDGDRYLLPVPFWHGDRLTAEPFPFLIDFELTGFDDKDLAPYLLDAYPDIVDEADVYNPNVSADGSMKSTRTYARQPWRLVVPGASSDPGGGTGDTGSGDTDSDGMPGGNSSAGGTDSSSSDADDSQGGDSALSSGPDTDGSAADGSSADGCACTSTSSPNQGTLWLIGLLAFARGRSRRRGRTSRRLARRTSHGDAPRRP
ncbi:MAG: G8 domain-containing protein [Nannocystaceae bacterium]|nr:G8 domain-containing protein [Nannocystaceae bacterium]